MPESRRMPLGSVLRVRSFRPVTFLWLVSVCTSRLAKSQEHSVFLRVQL